jgi:hypothetical protein
MAKEPYQKTNAELAQDLSTRPDSLIHLTAKAEMARRAAIQDQWRSWIMEGKPKAPKRPKVGG